MFLLSNNTLRNVKAIFVIEDRIHLDTNLLACSVSDHHTRFLLPDSFGSFPVCRLSSNNEFSGAYAAFDMYVCCAYS